MSIIVHTMQFNLSETVESNLELRNYCEQDYPRYRTAYNSCFAEMRKALGLSPVECCADSNVLINKSESIFILEIDNMLAGSVAIYGNEIDDLFVVKDFQRKGYGKGLLCFAAARLQRSGAAPILLHVADWNQGAMKLYLENGFDIIKTETV